MIIRRNEMEDHVTYEQAVKLKELGFDWEYGKGFQMKPYYNSLKVLDQFDEEIVTTEIPAPTLAQAQKWLRLVKNIIVNVIIDDDSDDPWSYEILSTIRDKDGDWIYLIPQWKTNFWSEIPEEALSVGIDKALEILNQKQ